ncbi:MAG: hypothetical protein RIT14_1113, partial [Pseudomonadota bacterium]
MTDFLPPLRLDGAEVLTDGRFEQRPVGVLTGQIVEAHGLPTVDLAGFWLMPGIIDLHGDGFERQVYPRPSAPFPLPAALA